MLLLSTATILAQNVYRPLRREATDRSVALLARFLVPVIDLVPVALTMREDQAIVGLLLMGYNFVTQLFSALLVSLGPVPLTTPVGAFCGILAGELTVAYLTLSGATLTLSGATLAALLPGAHKPSRTWTKGLSRLA
jgi:SSS family solute:Na+ symporter